MNRTQQYYYVTSRIRKFKDYQVMLFRENMGNTGILLALLGTIGSGPNLQIVGIMFIVGSILKDEIRKK